MTTLSYPDFLASKATIAPTVGYDVDPSEIHALLKPHQRLIVQWAVRGGRRAIFAAFGLGKSVMQLETLRLTIQRAGGQALIICPLGVRDEFAHDAAMLGLELHRIRTSEEARELPVGAIAITNYEPVRDGKLDPNLFTAASLDEAAILRSYGSKTYQTFLTLFDQVDHRFVATATPSPNRFKELLHYAGFLGIMDTGQALTRFFKRDSSKANNLTLLASQERNFWLWLASWSAWVQSPADLCGCTCHTAVNGPGGCEACVCSEYVLPGLEVTEHEIAVDHLARTNVERHSGQTYLLADAAAGVTQAAKEKRTTLPERVTKAVAQLQLKGVSTADQAIVYCHLNDEQTALERELITAGFSVSSIDGNSMTTDEAERRLTAWKARETAVLLGKPMMLGVGMNLQQANKAVFAGIDYRFHDLIQAVHRIDRFGQSRPCEVDLIFAESEREILKVLLEKWRQHEELTSTMTDLIREHGLSRASVEQALTRSLGVARVEASGDGWRLINNDCIPEIAGEPETGQPPLESESVDLVVTSIPFNTQYEYSPAYEDFGFNEDPAAFWEQMDYLTPELLRVLKPGVGSPEYVLLFHKPQTDRSRGYADEPVAKSKEDYSRSRWQIDAHAFWRSSGDRHLTPDELARMGPDQLAKVFTEQTLREVYDYESHVRIGEDLDGRGALPSTFMALAPGSSDPMVWHGVNRMRTLNGEQSKRGLTQHICPLQIDIVDRLIRRFSNLGDLVLDPFSGLGTVPVRALSLGRRGLGVELNGGYFLDAVKYLEAEQRKQDMPTLFDLLPGEADLKDAA